MIMLQSFYLPQDPTQHYRSANMVVAAVVDVVVVVVAEMATDTDWFLMSCFW
jgi:hypothetical protein